MEYRDESGTVMWRDDGPSLSINDHIEFYEELTAWENHYPVRGTVRRMVVRETGDNYVVLADLVDPDEISRVVGRA